VLDDIFVSKSKTLTTTEHKWITSANVTKKKKNEKTEQKKQKKKKNTIRTFLFPRKVHTYVYVRTKIYGETVVCCKYDIYVTCTIWIPSAMTTPTARWSVRTYVEGRDIIHPEHDNDSILYNFGDPPRQ